MPSSKPSPLISVIVDKYSDLFEIYSSIKAYGHKSKIRIIYRVSERVSGKSIHDFLENTDLVEHFASYEVAKTSNFQQLNTCVFPCDILIAPFVRYLDLWKLLLTCHKRKIWTVHVSECFLDSFGVIGYRLGFKLTNCLSILKIPLFILNILVKPDECFYPLYPTLSNPFVKITRQASFPEFNTSYKNYVRRIVRAPADTLVVSGFGLTYQQLSLFAKSPTSAIIASSKHREIIINGKSFPLNHYLTAEELLSCLPITNLITYESAVLAWARHINSSLTITCIEASGLKAFSPFCNFFIQKSLSKIGIHTQREA